MINQINLNVNKTSFGRATGFEKAVIKAGKIPARLSNFCAPSSSNSYGGMALTALAYPFLLGGRYLFSRDKHEKEEALVRDISSFFTLIWGVTYLKKGLGNLLPKQTQIPITQFVGEKSDSKISSLRQILNPSKGNVLAKLSDIQNWYCFNGGKSVENGKGQDFGDWVINLSKKMSLNKAFDLMGDEATKPLKEIFSDGIDHLTNEDIIQGLKTTAQKEAKEKLIGVCTNPKNNLLKKAEFYRSIPQIAGLALTVATLGLFFPWLTIRNTRKEILEENDGGNVQSVNNKTNKLNRVS